MIDINALQIELDDLIEMCPNIRKKTHLRPIFLHLMIRNVDRNSIIRLVDTFESSMVLQYINDGVFMNEYCTPYEMIDTIETATNTKFEVSSELYDLIQFQIYQQYGIGLLLENNKVYTAFNEAYTNISDIVTHASYKVTIL